MCSTRTFSSPVKVIVRHELSHLHWTSSKEAPSQIQMLLASAISRLRELLQANSTTYEQPMPCLQTGQFGPLEYMPTSALEFSEGLPGFESERSFILVERPAHHPLVFLQSLDTPKLCFPALPVRVVDSGYELQLDIGDLELLGFSKQPQIGDDAIVLVLIAVHEHYPTANLLAPVVINLQTRVAAQCIQADVRYSHRHPLVPALEAAS